MTLKSDEEHTDPDYYMIGHVATTDDLYDEKIHEPAVTATKCRSMMSKKRSSSAVNDDAAGTNKKLRTCIKPSESASEKKEAREKEAREKEAMEKEASEPEESGRESGQNTPAGQHGEGWNALMKASYNGHAPVVSILVRHGADMEVQDSRTGYTALMLASVQGHNDVVEVLLEAGAKIDAVDNEGNCALMLSLMCKCGAKTKKH